MANMSYCMFENTYRDLLDCADKLGDCDLSLSELSDSEKKYALRLIKKCAQIADWCQDMVEENQNG